MHPNPAFRRVPVAYSLAFARTRGFGVLTVCGADGPLAAHVPFVLSEDGTRLEAHLVRSNPVLAALPAPALMIVSGPDGYVSPDWYEMPDQVPTWNYVAVHLRGEMRALAPEALPPHAARLSASFEARLAPKPPWTEDKMDPETLARMRRSIVPVEMDVDRVDATWKLGQNKPDQVRHRAAARLPEGTGAELGHLSWLMRSPPASG